MITAQPSSHTVEELLRLCREVFQANGLVVASNRGPLEHHIGQGAQVQARRGSGAVVTALSSLTQNVDFTWVASAMGEGDRKVATQAMNGALRSPLAGQHYYMRYVLTPRREYHRYYNVFCNPLLWFLHHHMWNSPYSPTIDSTVYDAWDHGYVLVNRAFAQAIYEESMRWGDSPYISLQDYHLYLVGGYVREMLPKAVIQHFVHIPWPSPEYWHLLPRHMRLPIIESLCASNIVGFQTIRDARSFMQTCEEFLDGAVVDYKSQTVEYRDNQALVRSYPMSIDVDDVKQIATTSRATEARKLLEPLCNEWTIVRVDRAEPNKNIIRGFRAFELLLQQHPEFRGRVNFLAFLVPSRMHIRQYQRYFQDVTTLVDQINETYKTPEWLPITLFLDNNYAQAIAGMSLYDVLLVNPVIDGMNLVAKEGVVVNTKSGVLILTESAGVQEQLGDGAIKVGPSDIQGTKDALYEALVMPAKERKRRSDLLVDRVRAADVTEWVFRQISDMQQVRESAH